MIKTNHIALEREDGHYFGQIAFHPDPSISDSWTFLIMQPKQTGLVELTLPIAQVEELSSKLANLIAIYHAHYADTK